MSEERSQLLSLEAIARRYKFRFCHRGENDKTLALCELSQLRTGWASDAQNSVTDEKGGQKDAWAYSKNTVYWVYPANTRSPKDRLGHWESTTTAVRMREIK